MPDDAHPVATCRRTPRCKPLAASSDAELLAMVLGRGLGWKLGFNELLGRHREWLINHCAYRLGNRQDAQDVVQQVMIRAWRAIQRFQGRSAFRTWLYTIAENQCRTFAVRRMRYVQSEHIESLIDLYLSDTRIDHAESCARHQAVAAALRNVSDKAREVLLLRFFRECSLEEIAATLRISLSAAKMRLYRSLEQFRAAYLVVVDIRSAAV
jgi:RNA polymerase sigma-70 factor (ECF subfamily)